MDRRNQILLTSQSPGEITSEHPLVTDGLKTKESKKKKKKKKKRKNPPAISAPSFPTEVAVPFPTSPEYQAQIPRLNIIVITPELTASRLNFLLLCLVFFLSFSFFFFFLH
jgi:hypothetical protein